MHPSRRSRTTVRASVAVASSTVALAVVFAGVPANTHGDHDRNRHTHQRLSADTNAPLGTSPNVSLVASNPGAAGISGCFQRTAPLFVQSNIDSIRVYDVSTPTRPTLTGTLPSLQFENEAMNCGQRTLANGKVRRFVLIGVDTHQASPGDIEHTNVGGKELVLVDVTDPAKPFIRSRAKGSTSTHTVTCVSAVNCSYAYSAGTKGKFSIFDLRDLNHPREVDGDRATAGVQGFASPTYGHKWNFDDAGYGTHTGYDGASMWKVTNPRSPQLVTTTGAAGRGTDPRYPGWNDFILHNSQRPNARAFRPGASPSVAHGNVLFVTEEDYEQTDCSKAGSFQTWWVKRLDGTRSAIVPLDKVELADLGNFPSPQGTFCSSHWFDYHPSGIVSVAFYGGGTQFVDARNPRHLTSYGHATWGASEVWDSYWVPVYRRSGVMTARKTNLAYSVDLVRGMDVYRVDLPGSSYDTAMGATRAGHSPL